MPSEDKNYDQVNLSIPCASDYVGVIRLAISGIATRMNFSIEEIEDIKIAVSEACTNSVQYAYEKNQVAPRINIDCNLYENKLEIFVIDKGCGFDVKAIENNNPNNKNKNVPTLGLGMTFIKSLMDEADFISEIGKGTTVRMAKHI